MCLGGGVGNTTGYNQSWAVDYGAQPPAPVVPAAPDIPDDRNPSVQGQDNYQGRARRDAQRAADITAGMSTAPAVKAAGAAKKSLNIGKGPASAPKAGVNI